MLASSGLILDPLDPRQVFLVSLPEKVDSQVPRSMIRHQLDRRAVLNLKEGISWEISEIFS